MFHSKLIIHLPRLVNNPNSLTGNRKPCAEKTPNNGHENRGNTKNEKKMQHISRGKKNSQGCFPQTPVRLT
jgi:hypothetical protein